MFGKKEPYEILKARDTEKLQKKVNKLIKDGYRPCGGLTAASCNSVDDDDPIYFFQAMSLEPE